MKVLVIGNGGREHALTWKAAQSDLVSEVFVAPIDLTIVGPEAPLVAGIVDEFKKRNLKIFGPTKAAAQLEGSKSFTKDFLMRHNIPTAKYKNFTDVNEALSYLDSVEIPVVVKADGLAAGKGVIVAQTRQEAKDAVKDMLSGNAFGEAGCKVVIEDFLSGEEASFIVMVDGKNVLPMATSQDHKRVGDGDQGPNTGGMGAYSPAPVVTKTVYDRVMEQIIYPTVKGMAAENNEYVGFLYAGLMIDDAGNPKVIEFNCRFGDPETQPIMMRMKSDLVELCDAACDGKLDTKTCEYDERPAVGVVLAAEGYPQSPRKGDVISGLESAAEPGSKIFQAGTKQTDGKVVTSGGRVLCATALGSDIKEARNNAYKLAETVSWDGMFYRNDIAYRAIARLNK